MVRAKPASSKKQKRGVDFKKIRHKIGRKLPPPKNATNVQIKSKAIVLPQQSIASEKEGLAVNKKGLTLRELLQQTSHHNAKIRRVATTSLEVGGNFLRGGFISSRDVHKQGSSSSFAPSIWPLLYPSDCLTLPSPVLWLLLSLSSLLLKTTSRSSFLFISVLYVFLLFFRISFYGVSALFGIKDLILKYPLELKLHKHAIIEILRVRICDNDKMVRNTLYHLLKSVIFPSSKEEITAPVISLLMAYIFNAMTLMTVDIRLMAFKFFKLLALNYPSSFMLYAEKVVCSDFNMMHFTLFRHYQMLEPRGVKIDKWLRRLMGHVLDNYIDILKNNQIYLVEKNKLINVLAGLAHCLSLIANKGQRDDRLNNQNQEKFQRRVLHAYKLEVHEDHADEATAYAETEYTDDDKYIILDIKIAEICLCLTKWVNGIDFLSDKLVEFIEYLLLVGTNTWEKGAHMENHIVSLLPFIPRLLSQITANGKARLLEAFTCSFKECRVDSRLFTAYLSVVEELFLVTINTGLQMHASSYQDHLSHEIAWMRELPRILLHLSDEHPSNTMVVLKVLLRIGQCSVPNSPLGFEYDALQFLLREFYAIRSHSGSINYGPFLKLPNDCKELALCCLFYFSWLTSDFLESLAYCCLCNDMEPLILLRIVEVLQTAYMSGRVPVSEYMSFLVTLVARFRVSPERFLAKIFEEDSNRKTFKSITDAVFECLDQIGDSCIVLKLLFKNMLNEMLLNPPMDNFRGMLRMIIALDARLTKLSDEDIGDLSKILCRYMVDTASSMSEDPDVACRFSGIPTFDFFLKPCIVLLIASGNVLPSVLKLLNQFISEDCILLPSESDDKYGMDISSRINAVSRILSFMFSHKRLHINLSRNKAHIDHTLLIMHNLLYTFLLKPKLILCFPQQNLKRPVAQIFSWDHKPLHLLSHTHSNAPSHYVAVAAAGEGEVPLQEFDAFLSATAAAASGRNCQLLPFLQHLLEPHHLCDLVGPLRIHASRGGSD
ncbi:hypothetical protein ZIOFF_070168 [Zingiber officinale]|uniref:TEX10-like TPR repeats domain-containing protein n=1 Tax=Zingiber officinale TaxID=94328 RepID=A0A8J5CWI3_ZINOF|nr:hypothetical protein ZIOFF_070168 [Zingiber officinale]